MIVLIVNTALLIFTNQLEKRKCEKRWFVKKEKWKQSLRETMGCWNVAVFFRDKLKSGEVVEVEE